MKAFPNKGWNGYETIINEGMDLRDYFAAKAMQSMMSAGFWNWYEPMQDAKKCYAQADAMIKVREK